MKGVIAVCFLALASAALARPEDKHYYTDRYDQINLDDIFGNDKLMETYMACCLDKGKCTPEGKEMKSHITEAMETNCAKCTKAQREGSRKVIGHLINERPHYWEQLKAKYDPTGKFAAKYEEELKKIKH